MSKETMKKFKDMSFDDLLMKKNNIWTQFNDKEISEVMLFAENYKNFISSCKTERETVHYYEDMARNKGYRDIFSDIKTIKPNDLFYHNFRGKALFLMRIGEYPFIEGVNIIASHADSPRLDLKQIPIVEDTEIALLKTHYYGGIKKYQWLSIPLALHGIIVTSDGEKKEVVIGEKEDDPVFIIFDLLAHLSKKHQGEKKILEAVEGENLLVTVGNRPVAGDAKDKVKLYVLDQLYKRYGIKEEDFVSAELEAVPAFKARDVGIDRSMIGAYGHDDRVCVFASTEALLNAKKIGRTSISMIFDKEEIGSTGATGANSFLLHHLFTRIGELCGYNDNSSIRHAMINSHCLSADVAAAIDPIYKNVHDSQNAAQLSHGIALLKYSGTGGKSGANDADAEFVGKIKSLFNSNKIKWQVSTLGKVDEGGGGTVAKYIAFYGISTLDAGVPVIGMHSPYEIISKADLWMSYKAFESFFIKNKKDYSDNS